MSVKRGRTLQREEMLELIDALFACEQPQVSPGGKPCILKFSIDELNEKFKA
jgi:DNA mismatch repair protein MutL